MHQGITSTPPLSTTQQRLQRARGILSFGYDRKLGLLEIVFSSGRAYAYEGVPEGAVRWLTCNRDPAGFLRRFISAHYRYRELRATPPSDGSDDLEGALRRSVLVLQKAAESTFHGGAA